MTCRACGGPINIDGFCIDCREPHPVARAILDREARLSEPEPNIPDDL